MSSFSRFQDINQKRGIAEQNLNAGFIFKGYPTISIKNPSGQEVQASVVNRQEKDMAYIYTNLNTPLAIGSSWGAKGLNWLISEEIITIKDVKWHKYVAFLCNVEINGEWGYFLGPEKSYINVALKQGILLESQQKPMLILANGKLNFNDKIMIKDRAWLVQEKDELSTPGLTYYSLRTTTMSKDIIEENINNDVFVETDRTVTPKVNAPTAETILPDTPITFNTEEGYFKCLKGTIEILSLTTSKVTFKVAFGSKAISIKIKEKGNIITKDFSVEI